MTQEQTRKATETVQAQVRKNVETAQDQVVKNAATAQAQTRQNLETAQQQARTVATAAQDQWRQNMTTLQDQVRQNLTTTQEQFRQNVALWQEQVQALGDQWRQTFADPYAATRQTREAMTEGTERLAAQGAEVATAAFNATWDTWQAAFGVATWGQEQAEQALRQVIEQSRIAREESARLFREAAEQARRSQAVAGRMVQDGLSATAQTFRFPDFALPAAPAATAPATASQTQLDELNRKIDELSRKLDALQVAPANGTTPTIVKATK